jgi:REP element-mobilizing transposase RayT
MSDPLAYHVILGMHGFWLPNDPRGSWSTEVRAPQLRPFGPATTVNTRRSVAGKPHDRQLRRAAQAAMRYAPVRVNGVQAKTIMEGFAKQTRTSGYVIWAASILPDHVHLVVRRHRYSIKQVVRLLRQAGSIALLEAGLHPHAHLRLPSGYLPSCWCQDFWSVELGTADEIRDRIDYVEQNPVKAGYKPQIWSYVATFEGI